MNTATANAETYLAVVNIDYNPEAFGSSAILEPISGDIPVVKKPDGTISKIHLSNLINETDTPSGVYLVMFSEGKEQEYDRKDIGTVRSFGYNAKVLKEPSVSEIIAANANTTTYRVVKETLVGQEEPANAD